MITRLPEDAHRAMAVSAYNDLAGMHDKLLDDYGNLVKMYDKLIDDNYVMAERFATTIRAHTQLTKAYMTLVSGLGKVPDGTGSEA